MRNQGVVLPKRQFRELSLFTGAGGGLLAGKLLGWKCICAVEIDSYARGVLLSRQRDGCLEKFPIWDDIKTFQGKPWRGSVDVVSGGFPCTDISTANPSKKGLDGEKSGLWREMSRVICEVEPEWVFVENVPSLVVRGINRVLWDLASMGFDARWGVLGSEEVGIPMRRRRMWIVASRDNRRLLREGLSRKTIGEILARLARSDLQIPRPSSPVSSNWSNNALGIRGTNGMANRVDRIRAIGNGQNPRLAASAFSLLSGLYKEGVE